jgi:tetratricopeptide (TPR) repeat protein
MSDASIDLLLRRYLSAFLTALARPRRRWRLAGLGVLVSMIILGGGVAGMHVRVFYHLRAGRADLQRQHNAEALAHFQTYLRAWPDDPETLLLAARASWRLESYDEAESYLKHYQQVAGPDDELFRERHLLEAARGELDKAGPYFKHLLARKDAATPLILEALVQGCAQQYRLAEETAFLRNWLERRPDDTRALLFQANLCSQEERIDQAAALYRRVLQLDPDHNWARLALATILIEAQKYQEALIHVECLQRRRPDDWQTMVLLAQCHDGLGQPDAAEEVLDRVLACVPDFTPALAERGRLALRRGQLTAAETWLRRALVLEPGNCAARYQLVQCLLRQDKATEAERQQNWMKQFEADRDRLRLIVVHEMSCKPHDPALHHELAEIMRRRGDTAEWLRWLRSALRENPNYSPARRDLSQ